MSTPTPETDANCGFPVSTGGVIRNGKLYLEKEGPFVFASLARKLERERDEAREQTAAVVRVMDGVVKERDELRAEVERLKAENTTFRNAQMCCESCDDTITTELLRELKADKARLDWLENQGCSYNWSFTQRDGKTVYLCRNTTSVQFMTARQAIDAAMKGDA